MSSFLAGLGRSLLFVFGSAALLAFLFFGLLNRNEAAIYEMAGQQSDPETIASIRTMYRLDKPLGYQVLAYLNDLSPIGYYGEDGPPVRHISIGHLALKAPWLGRSYQSDRPVHVYMLEALPQTLVLALAALFFAGFGGMGLGLLVHRLRLPWLERLLLALASTGMALPSFFSAVLISWLFGFAWHAWTGLYPWGNLFEIDDWTGEKRLAWTNLLLPALTLGIRPLAVVMQMTQNSLDSAATLPHVRTGLAKGLGPWKLLIRHVFRNALGPVWTTISGWLGNLLAGAVFVEYIFGWEGLGRLMIQALNRMDYPVLMGTLVCTTAMFGFLQGITDGVHRLLDPRLQKQI